MKKIAIIGAPGSGKTTIATGLFYFLKKMRKKTEIIPELIKYKVYQDARFGEDGFDIENTGEQRRFEESVEKAPDIEFLICEAPLCNGYFYSSFYQKDEEWPVLRKIALKKINTYDIIIFVEHLSAEDYESFGRKEDRETSIKLENHIKDKFLNDLKYEKEVVYITQQSDIDQIIQKILAL